MLACKDDFLNQKECDFLISYFMKKRKIFTWESTRLMRMIDVPFYHLKVSLIWKKYIKPIEKDFPYLKLNHGEIVYWPNGSSKKIHTDMDIPSKNSVGRGIIDWTSVCYLNDNFEGGETIVDNHTIKPKKGRITLFNSKKLPHGVNKIYGKRYTLISWWTHVGK